jgi:hypothetical protein
LTLRLSSVNSVIGNQRSTDRLCSFGFREKQGEKMKRISTSALTISAIFGTLALASACSSGDAPPQSGTPGGTGGAAGSSGSGGASGTGAGATGGTAGASGTGAGATGGGGSAGTSGSGGSAGTSAAPSICDNNTYELPLAEAFVDDFESATRFAGWYSFADTTTMTAIARAAGGALSTAMGAHFVASGIKAPTAGGFGAGFGFGMKDGQMRCAGISAFDGVSFWAKGTAGANNALTFQAVLAVTQAKMDGGDCTANCYNHPAKAITLTADWKQYTVLWTELAGTHKVSGVILGLNWITPGPALDIWVDEVTLFKGTAPTGPVGMAGDGGP